MAKFKVGDLVRLKPQCKEYASYMGKGSIFTVRKNDEFGLEVYNITERGTKTWELSVHEESSVFEIVPFWELP